MIKLDNIEITEITESFKREYFNSLTARYAINRNESASDTIHKLLQSKAAQDRVFTSLKRLNYQKFYSMKAPNNDIYLCGKTKDAILKMRRDQNINVGPFHVCISTKSFVSQSLSPIHVFPHYAPLTWSRHLHHRASGGKGYNRSNPDDCRFRHPLEARPDWCWASIGSSYRTALQYADWVDLFRVLYIFVIRLDWHSPLHSNFEREAMAHGVPA